MYTNREWESYENEYDHTGVKDERDNVLKYNQKVARWIRRTIQEVYSQNLIIKSKK